MSYRILDGVMLIAHRARPPSDWEWESFMGALLRLDQHGEPFHAQLVVTDGGRPTSTQTEWLDSLPGWMHQRPIAVVTSSSPARGVVTALRWSGMPIRAFGPKAFDEAFAYLELDPRVATRVLAAITTLKLDLDSGAPRRPTGWWWRAGWQSIPLRR